MKIFSIQLISLYILLLVSSCANIAKNVTQPVRFYGADPRATVNIKTSTGVHQIKNGSGILLLARKDHDVQAVIECKGKSIPITLKLKYDYIYGGVLNIFTFGIGWLIDPFSNRGYNYQTKIDLSPYCH